MKLKRATAVDLPRVTVRVRARARARVRDGGRPARRGHGDLAPPDAEGLGGDAAARGAGEVGE